jgi:benzodiazapine receptor
MGKVLKLIISIATPFLAAAIGNLATIPNIPTWYASLNKPFFNPPNWIFGPVWTLLYVLMGIGLYLVWIAKASGAKKQAYVWFGIQLAFNALWSIVFFGMHMPLVALVVIVLLLIAISLMIRNFWRISRTAAWLQVPYVVWVTFATALTAAIALLNP